MLTLDPVSADMALSRRYELSDKVISTIKDLRKLVGKFLEETEPLRKEGLLAVIPLDEVDLKADKLNRLIKLRSGYESFLPVSESKLKLPSNILEDWPILSPPEMEGDKDKRKGNFREEMFVRFRYLSYPLIAQGVEAEMVSDDPTSVGYLRGLIYRRRGTMNGAVKNPLTVEIPNLQMSAPADILKARRSYQEELEELRGTIKEFTDEIRSREISSRDKVPRDLRKELKKISKLIHKIARKIESDSNISVSTGKGKTSPVLSVELFPYLSFRKLALGSSGENGERNSFVFQLNFNPKR
jgi:hypothetical protein